MAKYTELAAILESRIKRGDYLFRELPTEQKFAHETESSRMTARRALAVLIDKGVIVRKPNGRLHLSTSRSANSARKRSLALLTPAYASSQYDRWLAATKRVAASCDLSIQSVLYVHWDDAVIMQALKTFKGVFLVPHSEPIPPTILNHFSAVKNLISLDCDLTRVGVPSLATDTSHCVERLADHLYELGHRRIDFLNTQPPRRTLEPMHLTQWWQVHKVNGVIHDEPVEPYGDPTAKAYKVMSQLLRERRFTATGLICYTDAAAIGAMRALHEHGRVVGRDVSVCTVAGASIRYTIPSLTAFAGSPVDPYLELCMRWLITGNKPWDGPLRIRPGEMNFVKGESTAPAPAAKG